METEIKRGDIYPYSIEDRLERIQIEHRAENIALVNRLIGILRNNDELARELRRALNGEA
jgi:hypothetical protein